MATIKLPEGKDRSSPPKVVTAILKRKAKPATMLAVQTPMSPLSAVLKRKPVSLNVYSSPWQYPNYSPKEWLNVGVSIIIETIRIATKKVVRDGVSLSRFGTLNVPLTVVKSEGFNHTLKTNLEGIPVHKGAYNQGENTIGAYDSPIVDFDYENGIIGCRVGIHWDTKDSPKSDIGKPWWGVIRLYCEYDTKNPKNNKWLAHVRCEYEKEDDYEQSQEVVDRDLESLIKENKDHRMTFDVFYGKDAAKKAAELLKI